MEGQSKPMNANDKCVIDFEKIPSEMVLPLAKETHSNKITVLEEINAQSKLINERTYMAKDIKPLYKEHPKVPYPYAFKYYCICPLYKPHYCCQHTCNVIIDRDVLSREEHLVHLATPKPDLGAPRGLMMCQRKKCILPTCTARITKLAMPKAIRVKENLNTYKHLLKERNISSLVQQLKEKPTIEVTDIPNALALMHEERRLMRVARHAERQQCLSYTQKIIEKQHTQIKKIICVIFEEMKQFLLNDQFAMDEGSTLVPVILEAIKTFSDGHFHMTSSLREYQKILAFNIAIWINKFLSNLNIHIAAVPEKDDQINITRDNQNERMNISSFLPVSDYVSCSSENVEEWCEDESDVFEEYLEGSEETATAPFVPNSAIPPAFYGNGDI